MNNLLHHITMRTNMSCDTDAYKIVHWLQRPQNITKLYSYGEPRVGGFSKFICFFGLSPIIQDYFMKIPTLADLDEAEEECLSTFGTTQYFNRAVWEKVIELGYLPLTIKSVAEGTILEEGNVCFTIESTEPWFANMISHFEDYLMWVWYSTSVCTRDMNIKKGIIPAFEKSSDIMNLVLPVAVNDFGLRGATFFQGAVMGGMAHLVHFVGSDNMPASRLLKDYYGYKGRAKSVWATEHSVATAYGPGEGEFEYMRQQLNRFPNMIKSIVIDSYDADNFILNVVGSPEIKQMIIDHPGRIVFRPDSGKPLTNVCKYSDMLGGIFGFTLNSKGYKVLSHNVGLIQGDGMNEESIPELYNEYIKTGWAADNIITGSGGGLLEEGLTRDTQRWAVKASYGEKDGVPFDIQKKPKTDMTKASKRGLLKLHDMGRNFITLESSKETAIQFTAYKDSLQTVFHNGEFTPQNFEEIIKRASQF